MQTKAILLLSILALNSMAFGQTLEEALQHFDSGETKPAREYFSKLLSQNPQDAVATFYLARLDTQGDNSLAYLNEAIALSDDQPEQDLAQIILAQYNYAQGLYVTAVDRLAQFKAEKPDSPYLPQALYISGLSYLASDQSSLARREFETILKSYAATDLAPWAQLGLGDCQYSLNNFSAAGGEYQKVLDNFEKSDAAPLALAQLVRTYSELKDPSKSHLYLNLLTDKYPAGVIFPEASVGETKSKPGAEKMVEVTYTIQLGVFGNQSSVNDLIARMKDKGYHPAIFTKLVENKRYTVVQVGSFFNMDQARLVKDKLEAEIGGSYRVVLKE